MTNEECIKSLITIRDGYLKLIEEKVDSGKVVGSDGLIGEWKANTPLDDIYKHSAEALDMAINSLQSKTYEQGYADGYTDAMRDVAGGGCNEINN